MGYDFSKRLAELQSNASEESLGKLRLFKTLFLSLLVLSIIAAAISSAPNPDLVDDTSTEPSFTRTDIPTDPITLLQKLRNSETLTQKEVRSLEDLADLEWYLNQSREIRDRLEWLNSSPISLGGAEIYREISDEIFTILLGDPVRSKEELNLLLQDASSVPMIISRSLASAFLRLLFIMFTAWPLWIVGSVCGVVAFYLRMKPKPTDDLLGVCDRGTTPFYSGIYGPLRPNNSFSGTNYSCPNLACPTMASDKVARNHKLAQLLRRFGALNSTTLDLVKVIVSYKDYPAIVEEERLIEDDGEKVEGESDNQSKQQHFRTNQEGTIEQSALLGLEAILTAHELLARHFRQHAKTPDSEKNFKDHTEVIAKLSAKAPPLAAILACSLTPSRAAAVAALPRKVLAACYLATEAGKSLVYRREGDIFSQISRFPHLQARAVIQSLVSYHQEFDGDTRLVMRQAIICARRHGDFGRAFLPVNMPLASRALRDWLEILYGHPSKRQDVAHLVELDAHLEELGNNWKAEFQKQLERHRSSYKGEISDESLALGIVHKSVVLVPLQELVEIGLLGVHAERKKRISLLIDKTRKLQASLSISARLPGFKRQALEAEKSGIESGGITGALAQNLASADLVDGWLIMRRMLTRYNWLSTRVGDDSVPVDGLVKATVVLHDSNGKAALRGFDALVPLRQRRFKESLGIRWEQIYYPLSPRLEDTQVYTSHEDYSYGVEVKRKQLAQGLLDRTTVSMAQGT